VEDALHATRAAVEEGIVPGGGTALIRALKLCQDSDYCSAASSADEKTGMGIVAKAVEAPLRQLAANAGREGALIVEKVKSNPEGHGYNVATDTYEDLIASGVVDPTKVTRSALQNAASISGLLLTTECVITDLPEKEEAGGGHGHDHGGMGGMGGMM
jgi:chaperonin GroEL